MEWSWFKAEKWQEEDLISKQQQIKELIIGIGHNRRVPYFIIVDNWFEVTRIVNR